MTKLKLAYWVITFTLLIPSIGLSQNRYDTLKTVKMTAIAHQQPLSLTIQWQDDPSSNTYSLYKKGNEATNWGNPLLVTNGQQTSYQDTDIEEGKLYEYRMVKATGDTLGYAYLYSGVNYLPPQKKGTILLLIDAVAADFVGDNLTAYMNILRSEGWKPQLVMVSENASVAEIKSLILQQYAAADSLTTVLLLGNIAVPHSGNINPDGHGNHQGAWPADLYYGDIDGVWTDVTVNNQSSAYPRLHNVPGDGNFDQASIPSHIELIVGRLDFSELPVFARNQYELLDNYLQKNIAFRTGEYQVKRKAVFKNINPWKEGLGQNAIRNFVPLVSPDSIVYDDFFDAFYDSFLWSYGSSSGSMISSLGLGNINTYATNNFQAVFTAYFGSYYGDYDYENNYLRTVLASGKVLSTSWVGAPNWYFHPMGMGLDLGYCTLLTQNNTDEYYAGFFPQAITINLLGDPTLKAYIVDPPHDLTAIPNGNHMLLNWVSSEDDILGYQVYKKYADMDDFEAINLVPSTETTLVDSCVRGAAAIEYLVKAVKREITPSGSFINHSTGPIISLLTNPNVLPHANFTMTWEQGVLKGTNLSTDADQYHWMLPDGSSIFEEHFEIRFEQGGEMSVTLIASNDCFSDTLEQILVVSPITTIEIDKLVKVYPNPVQDFFTLETAQNINKLYLYNVLGNCLLIQSNIVVGTHSINVENLPEGTYFLKIYLGNQIIMKKVTLQHS